MRQRIALLMLVLLLAACGNDQPEAASEATLPAVAPQATQALPVSASPAEGAPPQPGDAASTAPAETLGSDAAATPFSTDQVPGANLAGTQGAQRATTGAYCITAGTGNSVCADTFALIAPTQPLVVAPGETLTFSLEAGAPSFVTLRVLEWRAVDDGGTLPESVSMVDIGAPLVASGDLAPGTSITWEAPPTAGDFILDMNTVYPSGDSIAYGWHIQVSGN